MTTTPEQPGLTRRQVVIGVAGTGVALALSQMTVSPAIAAQAWGGYQNGYIPLSAMVRVSYPGVDYWAWDGPGTVDGVYLEPGAANALVSMLAAYASAYGSYLSVNEGYRSFAGQQYWYGREPYPGGAPGSSNHGWGKAIDFDNFSPIQESWVLANCGRFSYQPLPGDRVHYSYVGPNGPPAQVQGVDEAMIRYISTSASADGVIPAGMSFIQGATGPLRPLSQLESDTYTFYNSRGIPIRDAVWPGEQIRAVTRGCGVMQWSGAPNNVPMLTGRVIYADPAVAVYPKMSVG